MRLGHDQLVADQRKSAVIAGLGWDQVDMLLPVRPGDLMRLRGQVVDKRRSVSKPDRGIVVYQMELCNQRDEVVLRLRAKSLVKCREPTGED